jgi:Rrp15p
MARKKKIFGKKAGKHNDAQAVDKKALDRFAGSSDEDDEGDLGAVPSEPRVIDEHQEYAEERESDEEKQIESEVDTEELVDQPFVTNDTPGEADPGQKMAGVMAKILGTSTKTSKTSAVVLAKTTTPLQRLQKMEKEKLKAIKLKRQATRERNLAALHIPLSVATSNNIGEGRLSITRELEQERFHRRVATRGVVALFNAISQHQNSTEVSTMFADLSRGDLLSYIPCSVSDLRVAPTIRAK